MPDRLLAAIHPNVGVEAEYRRRLQALIDRMTASVDWFTRAAYRAHEPKAATLAMDALPADELKRRLSQLGDRWRKAFEEGADALAVYFATEAAARTDFALRQALKRLGITFKFEPTPAQADIMQATVHANVALIRSIPEQYFTQVEGSVMRAVQLGGRLDVLTKELQEHHGVTYRRASIIANSQNAMATSALHRARQLELGVTQAVWVHSGAGREPRPTHVAAGRDHVVFDVAKGWFDPHERAWIQPGQLINCRCVGRSVIPALA
jgi:uncharacterized protein with gpF-like domain